MGKNLTIKMVVEQCKIYNSLMNKDGVSKYAKGHLDGTLWILDKMGVIVTIQRYNGLCCNPIEKVVIYFKDEDYITTQCIDDNQKN